MTMLTAPKEARVLTLAALENINKALSDSEDANDFLARVDAIVSLEENRLLLPMSYGTPEEINGDTSKVGVDIENGPKVHDYLGEMDRANAADPRLWTYLAFVTYRTYMEERWSLNGVSKWKNRVNSRWLLNRVTRGSIVRHGIARLWWITHLTYEHTIDPLVTPGDRYRYTKQVFMKEDRINAIFDREIGAMRSVMRAVVQKLELLGEAANEKYVRNIMRSLTLVHGYRDIGLLKENDITDLIDEIQPT